MTDDDYETQDYSHAIIVPKSELAYGKGISINDALQAYRQGFIQNAKKKKTPKHLRQTILRGGQVTTWLRRLIQNAFVPLTVQDQARRERSVIHGAQSINAQVLPFLRRPTKDYDILETRPRASAIRLERRLDKEAGMDAYMVIPAQHKGTYKVVDRSNGNTIADFTGFVRQVPTTQINGLRYSTLGYEAKRKRAILQNKLFAYRHQKAKEDYARIQVNRKLSKA